MVTEIHRTIVYTKTPLKGFFRYENKFQIYPYHSEELEFDRFTEHFPIYLEYAIESQQSYFETMTNGTDKTAMECLDQIIKTLNRILRILTSVTNHHFFLYPHSPQWSYTLSNSGASNVTDPVWSFPGGHRPSGSAVVMENFSSMEHLSEIEMANHKDYFSNHPLDNRTGSLKFPETISVILCAYYNLSTLQLTVAHNSSNLIANGVVLSSTTGMKSLALVAYISSIETISDFYFQKENKAMAFKCNACKSVAESPFHCPECKEPVWAISHKFRTFLSEVVSSGENFIKRLNKIYGQRSKIVHNGTLLLGDDQFDWEDLNNPEGDWFKLIETNQVARLALVHWMISIERARILGGQ